jgi:hypothetical protein
MSNFGISSGFPASSSTITHLPEDGSPPQSGSDGEGSASLSGGSNHSSARSGQSMRYSIISQGRAISKTLKTLLKELKKITQGLKHDYVTDDAVEHNATNIRCPAKNIVTIKLPGTDGEPITYNLHANEIEFTTGAIQEQSKKYIAAQSPIPKNNSAAEFFACDKFLTKAIESKSGLFQFVSPSKTKDENHISRRSIIGQLINANNNANKSSEKLLIGNRYEVKNIRQLDRSSDSSTENSEFNTPHFALDVEDTHPDSTGKKARISIVLTQARVKFENKLLSTTAIKEASALMDDHNFKSAPTNKNRPDPMVISQAGIGRNATLIVYREMLGRIRNGTVADIDQLEKEVINLIRQGREVRGPQFVHSNEQIIELVKALQEELLNEESLEEPPINQQPEVPTNKPPAEHEKEPLDNAAQAPFSRNPNPERVSRPKTSTNQSSLSTFDHAIEEPSQHAVQERTERIRSGTRAQINRPDSPASVILGREYAPPGGDCINSRGPTSGARPTADLDQVSSAGPEELYGVIMHTLGPLQLELERVNTMLTNPQRGSHRVIGISGLKNNCWWRATWVSVLLRYASLGGSPNQLEEILVKKLGTNFREDAKRITTMITAIQKGGGNGVAEILTEDGELKLPGSSNGYDGGRAEETCMHLTGELLKHKNIPLEEYEESVYGWEMGDGIFAAAICNGLGIDMVTFSPGKALTVCAQADSKLRLMQPADEGPQSLTDEVIKAIDKSPVLMFSHPHYNIAIPN